MSAKIRTTRDLVRDTTISLTASRELAAAEALWHDQFMTDSDEGHTTSPYAEDVDVPEGTLSQLASLLAAVQRLNVDQPFFLEALIEQLTLLDPVEPLPDDGDLVVGGFVTRAEWQKMQRSAERGDFQAAVINTWMSAVASTVALDTAARRLRISPEAVTQAVQKGTVHAVTIRGQLRFPLRQFDVESPTKLLPQLPELLKALRPTMSWISVAGFMGTPQNDLDDRERRTPAEWLRQGGDVAALPALLAHRRS